MTTAPVVPSTEAMASAAARPAYFGSLPPRRCRKINRASTTLVRDDRSSDTCVSSSIGFSETSTTLRTLPRAQMPIPRTRRRSPMVAAAATGMSARSASSSATRRAISAGSAVSSSTAGSFASAR